MLKNGNYIKYQLLKNIEIEKLLISNFIFISFEYWVHKVFPEFHKTKINFLLLIKICLKILGGIARTVISFSDCSIKIIKTLANRTLYSIEIIQ